MTNYRVALRYVFRKRFAVILISCRVQHFAADAALYPLALGNRKFRYNAIEPPNQTGMLHHLHPREDESESPKAEQCPKGDNDRGSNWILRTEVINQRRHQVLLYREPQS